MQPETLKYADRDSRLAEVLAGVTARFRQGEWPDLEALAAAYPDLADELRSLWPAILIAEEAARPEEQRPGPLQAAGAQHQRANLSPSGFGDYEILEELGRGGMGVVYKARQRSLDRIVALKMILHADLASSADRERFKVEAEAAARLDHPHIVPVFETGEHEGRPYFTMKFIEGRTLAERVHDGPLPCDQAARYALAVARAVHHAHQAGILHRDLKPSNVLVDRNDQVHVTDFGLAKRVPAWEQGDALTPRAPASLTVTGAILGTPGYVPPEQAAGRRGQLSPASDTYGIGAILYHLLTGRPPFQAASAVDTLMLVLEQDPLPPRLLNPRVDRDLELICLKCLQKPMDLRYQSAQDLARDLQAYLEGTPLSVRPGSMLQVLARMLRPTHHAAVLENWGLLWMLHSFVVLLQCGVTAWMAYEGVESRSPYLFIWGVALLIWCAVFWRLRKRGGPVTFVERQVAHVWGGAVITAILLFVMEMSLRPPLPVLTLSPVLALVAGMVFMSKAGMLSGAFYVQAVACFATALVMTQTPNYVGVALLGLLLAGCFFVPGWKYWRLRASSLSLDPNRKAP